MDSYGCGEDNTTCPNETTCCAGKRTCCPVENEFKCCNVEDENVSISSLLIPCLPSSSDRESIFQCSPSVNFCPLVKQGRSESNPFPTTTIQSTPTLQAICCPDWEGGPRCCYSFMQCAPNGSPGPCMVLTKPANVTFSDGFNLMSSFPASDVGPQP